MLQPSGVVVLSSQLIPALGPRLSETPRRLLAQRLALLLGTRRDSEERKLFEIQHERIVHVAVERADALCQVIHGSFGCWVMHELDHWPRSRDAAEEMVDAEAFVAGVELNAEWRRKLTEDLYRLGLAVIAAETRQNPAARKATALNRSKSRRNSTPRKRQRQAKQEVIAA